MRGFAPVRVILHFFCFVVLVSNVSLAVVVHHHHIVIQDSIDFCDPKTQFQFITSVNDVETSVRNNNQQCESKLAKEKLSEVGYLT